MIASYPERHFQLWVYRVSHGSFLVRSPRTPSIATNIDIIFTGVKFISLPRYLKGIDLALGSSADVQLVQQLLCGDISLDQVFVLFSEGKRFHVVAAGYKVDENEADIFDDVFA